ncbi:MAG: GTPase [Planctomycetes bacterium]|nr:GTPase [Planctomycetota bacterium]
MVQINFARREVNCKIVYYGPGLSGKTTNLEMVHQKAPPTARGQLTSIATEGDRTLFFDFLPLDIGEVAGMRTKFQLYTVPGQTYYNSTRKLVLQGVDGIVFVADSNPERRQENLESFGNLEINLKELNLDLKGTPWVIQFNKRDLPAAMPASLMNQELNKAGVPTFEAVAYKGDGVLPTLKAISAMVLEKLNRDYAPSRERLGSVRAGDTGVRAASPVPGPAAPLSGVSSGVATGYASAVAPAGATPARGTASGVGAMAAAPGYGGVGMGAAAPAPAPATAMSAYAGAPAGYPAAAGAQPQAPPFAAPPASVPEPVQAGPAAAAPAGAVRPGAQVPSVRPVDPFAPIAPATPVPLPAAAPSTAPAAAPDRGRNAGVGTYGQAGGYPASGAQGLPRGPFSPNPLPNPVLVRPTPRMQPAPVQRGFPVTLVIVGVGVLLGAVLLVVLLLLNR